MNSFYVKLIALRHRPEAESKVFLGYCQEIRPFVGTPLGLAELWKLSIPKRLVMWTKWQFEALLSTCIGGIKRLISFSAHLLWENPRTTVICLTAGICYWKRKRLLNFIIQNCSKVFPEYRSIRETFNSTPLFSNAPINNHSHGKSAGLRTAANLLISNVILKLGLSQFSFQSSFREQRNGMRNHREFVWTSDTKMNTSYDVPNDTDVISMVDVDYYLDMEEHLTNYPLPHLLYTVTPVAAGANAEDYSFVFNEKNEIVWRVTGGAEYVHKIWNYSVDTFVATRTFFGFPYYSVLYDCVTRYTGENKSVVCLTPIRSFGFLTAWWSVLTCRVLKRLSPVDGTFAKIEVTSPEGLSVSVARLNSCTAATVPIDVYNSLRSTKKISPNEKLNLYQVKAMLDHENRDIIAPILDDYLSQYDGPGDRSSVNQSPAMIKVSYGVPDPADKPCMVPFARPFCMPGFVPLNNKLNNDQSIRGRVEECKKVLTDIKMTAHKARALEYFVTHLIPDHVSHTLVPLSPSDIEPRQTKPGQKKDFLAAGFTLAQNIVKTFMKKEVYGKPTDPRNITTFSPRNKIDYAAFMYPIMDYMKQFPFYAFGRNPKDVAESVANVAMKSKTIVCGDISRMDGHVKEFCRDLEVMVGLRLYQKRHHADFKESHASSFGNMGVNSYGTWYDQDFTRGSGEMGTSVWNTIINLYIMFLGYTYECDTFDKAWENLIEKCIAGGDDGVTGDMHPATLIRAGRDVGFVMKAPFYKRGDPGVNFLARVYAPDVWSGNPNSMCSLKRQLEKLHLTVDCNIDPEQKLFEKCLSFSLTDKNTPIIGDIAKKVLRLSKRQTTGTLVRWGDDVSPENQYPNYYEDWMSTNAAEELVEFDYVGFVDWIAGAKDIETILNCPNLYPEGREFSYEGWSATPGLVILDTLSVYGPKAEPIVSKLREERKKKKGGKEKPVRATKDVEKVVSNPGG